MKVFRSGKLPERFIRIALATLSIFAALSVSACKEKYKLVEIKEGFIHFSFEYPASYEAEPRMSIGFGGDSDVYTKWAVSRHSPETARQGSKGNIVLQIIAIAPKIAESGRNAEYWYEDSLRWRSSQLSVNIIERSTIKEGIISGKSFTFSRLDYTNSETPTTMIEREIFFDKNGIPFVIQSVAEQSAFRQAETDLNHLLRTFRILD